MSSACAEAESEADAVLQFIRRSPKKAACPGTARSGRGTNGRNSAATSSHTALALASSSFATLKSSSSAPGLVAARPLLEHGTSIHRTDMSRRKRKKPARVDARAALENGADVELSTTVDTASSATLAQRAERVRRRKRRLALEHDAEARNKYHDHYHGLQAAGDSGLTQLEELINVALAARDRSTARGERRGAALRSARGRVFDGCTVDVKPGGVTPLQMPVSAAAMKERSAPRVPRCSKL